MNEFEKKQNEWYHRIDMCQKINEGCELEDAIGAICSAANTLHAWEDFYCHMLLLMAENLCREYINTMRKGNCEWEEYNELDPEMFKHFTGGAEKWTEEFWNQNYGKTY